jgi:hypothetical protein
MRLNLLNGKIQIKTTEIEARTETQEISHDENEVDHDPVEIIIRIVILEITKTDDLIIDRNKTTKMELYSSIF